MNFKKPRGTSSVKYLKKKEKCNKKKVMNLFKDGRVFCGNLNYITEYSTLFETQLALEHVYWKVEDMSSAIGICKIVFED